MLFFCELYVIRDELALLLGRTAHHPRSWASTSYNYNCLPATSRMVLEQRFRSSDESCLTDGGWAWSHTRSISTRKTVSVHTHRKPQKQGVPAR